MGRVMVTPMPTAEPFMAAITGLVQSKIRSVTQAAAVAGRRGPGHPGPLTGPRASKVSAPEAEVGAGAEGPTPTGDDHHPHLVVGVDTVERVDQLAASSSG